MVFRRYEFQVLLRLVLIVVSCLAVVYVWQLKAYYISLYNLIFLLALQVYLFFRYLTRWQQDVKLFASSVKHGDYNITYHLVSKHDPYHELYQMLNTISSYVRNVKAQSVQQNHYFQYIVENSQVGLMAYDEKGTVLLSNEEALRLLGVNALKTLNQLKDFNPGLHEQLSTLDLNQPRLIRLEASASLKLSARLSKIVIDEKPVFLLSLINIKSELDENELQSWQDLISVLTHEIMNSVTPINSLSGSLAKYLDRVVGNEEIIAKAKYSLDVMTRRSRALMNFVDRYRMISTVPLPRLERVDLGALIAGVLKLMENELSGVQIQFVRQSQLVDADPSMIEQVLINLFKNALNAMSQKVKTIVIETVSTEKFAQIRITDSGSGISSSVVDKIFIPFFTTREHGSGIGLTLSRQIMHRHGGAIEVKSTEGNGSMFTLSFPLKQTV
jgi:two-component system, NtrC family, nitrogen regulation sensor histidine kinase NtrY